MNLKKSYAQIWRHLVLAIFGTIVIIPILWVIISSLKSNKEILAGALNLPEILHFENYATVWVDAGFKVYILNSIIVCSISTLIVIIISTLAAFAFARLKFKGNNLIFFIIYSGMAFPIITKVVTLMSMMYRLNLTNSIWSLILIYSGNISFSILMLRSFFRQFPYEIEEAAKIDGANRFQFILKILLPLSTPALATLSIFVFMFSWREFLIAFLLIFREEARTLPIGLMGFQGEYSTDFNLAFSGIVISVIPVIIFFVFFQRHFIKGLTAGSYK